MRAFLFSGQGTQKDNMASDLLGHKRAAALYEKATNLSGIEIKGLVGNELSKTMNTQIAVSIYSAALWAAIPEAKKQDAVLAGFSLGEYSALFAAGVVDLAGLVQLVLWRSAFMQEVIDRHDALGMTAILGLDAASIERVLKEQGAAEDPAKAVYAVNYNSPEQTVISGYKATMEALAPHFKAAGAKRLIPLKVAGAFHSPYFADAAKQLETNARTLTFAKPQYPLYGNVLAARIPDDTDWPAYLSQGLISPIYFTKELHQLEGDGISQMIEVGPGNTLIGLVKKTLPEMTTQHASEFLT